MELQELIFKLRKIRVKRNTLYLNKKQLPKKTTTINHVKLIIALGRNSNNKLTKK